MQRMAPTLPLPICILFLCIKRTDASACSACINELGGGGNTQIYGLKAERKQREGGTGTRKEAVGRGKVWG